jgi:hypothetical protein
MYQSPMQTYQSPMQCYQAPQQSYQSPQQSYQSPYPQAYPPTQNLFSFQAPPMALPRPAPIAYSRPLSDIIVLSNDNSPAKPVTSNVNTSFTISDEDYEDPNYKRLKKGAPIAAKYISESEDEQDLEDPPSPIDTRPVIEAAESTILSMDLETLKKELLGNAHGYVTHK